MWLTTLEGFISIVQDRDDADLMQVRARVADDIAKHFPTADVLTMPGADYLYRARVPRTEVAAKIADMIMTASYTSHFKDEALAHSAPSPQRLSAYYSTWGAMAQMQPYAPYSTVPRDSEPGWYEWEGDSDGRW